MVNATVTATAVEATRLAGFERLFFLLFIGVLIWFIVTVLIMLVLASKSHKKGQILTVFIVMTLLLLAVMLVGYFNIGTVAGWVGL